MLSQDMDLSMDSGESEPRHPRRSSMMYMPVSLEDGWEDEAEEGHVFRIFRCVVILLGIVLSYVII